MQALESSLLSPGQPITGGQPQAWRPGACSISMESVLTFLSLGRQGSSRSSLRPSQWAQERLGWAWSPSSVTCCYCMWIERPVSTGEPNMKRQEPQRRLPTVHRPSQPSHPLTLLPKCPRSGLHLPHVCCCWDPGIHAPHRTDGLSGWLPPTGLFIPEAYTLSLLVKV